MYELFIMRKTRRSKRSTTRKKISKKKGGSINHNGYLNMVLIPKVNKIIFDDIRTIPEIPLEWTVKKYSGSIASGALSKVEVISDEFTRHYIESNDYKEFYKESVVLVSDKNEGYHIDQKLYDTIFIKLVSDNKIFKDGKKVLGNEGVYTDSAITWGLLTLSKLF